MFIADSYANRIRKVDTSGNISTFAGAGSPASGGFAGDGGAATAALLYHPRFVAVSPSNEVFISDTSNERVRRVDGSGTITTYAGNGSSSYSPPSHKTLGDGGPATGVDVALDPAGLAFDRAGTLYIADTINSRVRSVGGSKTIATVAGSGLSAGHGIAGFSGDGGPATKALLKFPKGIGLSPDADLLIADTYTPRVRLVTGIAQVTPQGGAVTAAFTVGAGNAQVCGTGQVGAPVATATGEFWHTFPSLAVPGRGPGLALSQTYSTFYAATDGVLGYGWRHCYLMGLNVSGSNATITQETGAQVAFTQSSGVWSAAPRVQATLVHNGGGTWTFTRDKREVITFDSAGQLTAISDLNGETTTFVYSSGKLATATDASGRTLTFAYTGTHLTSVTDSGSPARSVSFAYDGNGDLVTYTDVNGGVTAFTYDGSHRMLTMLDPAQAGSGSPEAITNHYDGSGRVDWQDDQLNRRTSFAYGTNTTTITHPKGDVTLERYTDGLITSVTDGSGSTQPSTWDYTYDPATLLQRMVTDPNGHVAFHTYDSQGNETASTDGLGRVTTATYNGFDEPLTVTDPLGTSTTTAYDGKGNLTSESRPLKNGSGVTIATRTMSYTRGTPAHLGDVTAIVDPNGNTWSRTYDTAGNLASVTAPATPENPAGNKTTITYDTFGRMTSTVPPAGNISGATPSDFARTFTYNPFGEQLTESQAALGLSSSRTYRIDGLVASETDRNGHTTSYTYDLAGQLTTTTRPDTTTLGTGYDTNGNVTTQTDGVGRSTTYHYDALNRVDWTQDPLARQTSNSYDAAGNPATLTAPNGGTGLVTTFAYDAGNQLTGITYSDSTTPAVTNTYDDSGRRTSMVDGSGTTSYTWDSLDRLTATTATIGGTVSYAYDLAGQPTSIVYPGPKTVSRHYDAAGRPDWVEDWLSPANRTTFAYDPNSNLTTTSLPNTTTATNSYDHADQLTGITHKKAGTTFAAFGYTRDNKGLLTSVTPTGLGSNETYGYTTLDQLKQLNGTTTYTNDTADNLTKLAGSTFIYDNANQLATQVTGAGTTTFAFDQRGDRTTTTPPAGGAASYTYDQASRLKTAASYTYTYNGDGLRLRKKISSTNTNFTWDLTAQNPLLLSDGTTNYIYGADGLPIEQVTGTTPQYFQHDQIGSTRLLTDTSGNAAGTYSYDAYGNQTAHTGTATSPLRYTGEYTDNETGFQYLRARTYDPATGQFLSRDPAAAITRSAYIYTDSDPINATDPSGRCLKLVSKQRQLDCEDFVVHAPGGTIVGRTTEGPNGELSFAWAARLSPHYRRKAGVLNAKALILVNGQSLPQSSKAKQLPTYVFHGSVGANEELGRGRYTPAGSSRARRLHRGDTIRLGVVETLNTRDEMIIFSGESPCTL